MSADRQMRLEEAMVYVLAGAGRGMSTDAIAATINNYGFHRRRDGLPVSSAQVYAAVMRNPDMFVKEGGLIHLMI